MTDKITLADLGSLENENTAINVLNNNSAIIQTAFDNTLSRDGTSPNQMGANLDMNSNQILNLPSPATINSPARLIDVMGNPTITVPPVGTSGATVPLLNANNTFSGTNTFTNAVIDFTQSNSSFQETLATKLNRILDVKDYGAAGNGAFKVDGAITSGSHTLTSASSTFAVSDIGKVIRVVGAGSTSSLLETTISAYISPTSVTLTVAAGTSVTGATFIYGTDDTASIQAAIIQGQNTGLQVKIPTGLYLVTVQLNITASVNIIGEGAGSVIAPASGSHGLFINTTLSVILEKFQVFYISTAQAGFAGIVLTSPSGSGNIDSVFRNLTIENAYYGILVEAAAHFIFDGIKIYGMGFAGIVAQNTLVGDAGDSMIMNCFMEDGTYSHYGVFFQSGGGLHIINNNFLEMSYGVYALIAAGVNSSQLIISENAFDFSASGLGTAGIGIQRTGSNAFFGRINIENNLFATARIGVYIPLDANGPWLNQVNIIGNQYDDGGVANNVFASIASTNCFIINSNNIRANVSTTAFLVIDSSATSGIVSGNCLTGTFSPSAINSTSTSLFNNVGYGPSGIFSPATMGASPFTYISGACPETHYINQSATNTATIIKGGATVATLTGATTYHIVELQPNQSYITTWATTAPTYTKDIH